MSEDDYRWLPVKWIENYTYCPRKIYFLGVLGLRERQTEFMKEGKEEGEDLEKREKRRLTFLAKRREEVLERWFDVALRSDRLGLVGMADMVMRTKEGLSVVDFKDSTAKGGGEGFLYQTAAYGVMVEEKFEERVAKVIVYYSKDDKVKEYALDQPLRAHVEFVAKRMRRIVNDEWVPPGVKGKKCASCGFRYVCRPERSLPP